MYRENLIAGELMEWLSNLNSDPALIYVVARSFLLFIVSIILIRYGNRRYSLNTAFDYLLLVILGGLISRGINGSSSLLTTVTASMSLVFFHRGIAILTYRFKKLEPLFKGEARLIIEEGEFLKKKLQQYHLTENDVLAEMRTQLHTTDIKKIAAAYLEATGRISFICQKC
ncbi:YetF domain-containing protein [Legionella cardiaca]|uniref:DUF421 domain-containing protein n=1 Tax=Legionella cardiaca TaxID=1071983 RepID=A0ABY8AV83_9GAMM|nr:YetF domain-containing protein [Legionella cardiaca]WED43077.1 DUF421 domain-containing protein [Legionella cardiaca]